MRDGFVRAAACTGLVSVADPAANELEIERLAGEAAEAGAKVIVFPELAISGYTCEDLFWQESLREGCREALGRLVEFSGKVDALIFAGLPFEYGSRLYNVAAAVHRGRLLALIPKLNIPNSGELYEGRHFSRGPEECVYVDFGGEKVPFGTKVIIENTGEFRQLKISADIGSDLEAAAAPAIGHCAAGASLMVNLSACAELVGRQEYMRGMARYASMTRMCAYVRAFAGEGESSQDAVYAGGNLIVENGVVLKEAPRFGQGIIYADIDIDRIAGERLRSSAYTALDGEEYVRIAARVDAEDSPDSADSADSADNADAAGSVDAADAALKVKGQGGESAAPAPLLRRIDRSPFIPEDERERRVHCETVLNIQAHALKKRLSHIGMDRAVVGISGGLDSTLALLVTVRTFDIMGIPRERIEAVTMPCFGTTDRTYTNACSMVKALGATLREVDIRESVLKHFADIGQDVNNHDTAYENSQARERTQVLMDIANMNNALMIGTGDLSELVLGWATYNGDHMSMYGVNAGVPKTMVRHLVSYWAESCRDEKLSGVLRDVLDTPVSPELIPAVDGRIVQQTEDIVGPYELHDFFLFYVLRYGFAPAKILRLALQAFEGSYSREVIRKWLRVFYRRFFTQQFKRSCLADGPKVGTVGVSPRGDLRMPSDASMKLWMGQIEKL